MLPSRRKAARWSARRGRTGSLPSPDTHVGLPFPARQRQDAGEATAAGGTFFPTDDPSSSVKTRELPDVDVRLVLGAATLVAVVATAGSLFLSLGLGLVPCRLCWYQRILMYPLVVVLAVAAVERRVAVARAVLPLVGLGGTIAAYHSWLQVSQTICGVGVVGCAQVQYRVAGLTVPNLSLLAFCLVGVAVGLAWWRG